MESGSATEPKTVPTHHCWTCNRVPFGPMLSTSIIYHEVHLSTVQPDLLSDDLLLSVPLHPAGGQVVGLQGLVQRAVQILLRLNQLVPGDGAVT